MKRRPVLAIAVLSGIGIAAFMACVPFEKAGPRIANTPGMHTFGSRKPSGNLPLGISVGNSRRFTPAAAMTTLDPSLSDVPE